MASSSSGAGPPSTALGGASPRLRLASAAAKLIAVIVCASFSPIHSFPHLPLTTTSRTSTPHDATEYRRGAGGRCPQNRFRSPSLDHRERPWSFTPCHLGRGNRRAFRGGGQGTLLKADASSASSSASFYSVDGTRSSDLSSAAAPAPNRRDHTAPSSFKVREFASRNFFVLGMVVAVVLARLAPALGTDGGLLKPELVIGRYGVALIFLLSGLALEPAQIKSALSNVKLLGIVQCLSFVVWPVFGLAIRALLRSMPDVLVTSALADGVLMVATLPTTVNMCVILTGSADGNVAAALCNAALGNVAGVLLTPALLLRLFGSNISIPISDMILGLTSKVALPVGVGQLLRFTPAKAWYQAHSKAVKRAQEVILLSILWNAFCTAFSSRIGLAWSQLLALLVFLPLLHWAAFEAVFRLLSRPQLKLSRQDVVAGSFCASQKTLAFGLPLLRTMFQGSPHLVSYCAPLMLIHPTQLVVGTFLLPRLRRFTSSSSQQGPSGTEDSKNDSLRGRADVSCYHCK